MCLNVYVYEGIHRNWIISSASVLSLFWFSDFVYLLIQSTTDGVRRLAVMCVSACASKTTTIVMWITWIERASSQTWTLVTEKQLEWHEHHLQRVNNSSKNSNWVSLHVCPLLALIYGSGFRKHIAGVERSAKLKWHTNYILTRCEPNAAKKKFYSKIRT